MDIATVLFDLQPRPAEVEDDEWVAEPVPSDTDLVVEGVKGLVRTPVGLAGRALGAVQRPGHPWGRSARRPRAWARWSGPG